MTLMYADKCNITHVTNKHLYC